MLSGRKGFRPCCISQDTGFCLGLENCLEAYRKALRMVPFPYIPPLATSQALSFHVCPECGQQTQVFHWCPFPPQDTMGTPLCLCWVSRPPPQGCNTFWVVLCWQQPHRGDVVSRSCWLSGFVVSMSGHRDDDLGHRPWWRLPGFPTFKLPSFLGNYECLERDTVRIPKLWSADFSSCWQTLSRTVTASVLSAKWWLFFIPAL